MYVKKQVFTATNNASLDFNNPFESARPTFVVSLVSNSACGITIDSFVDATIYDVFLRQGVYDGANLAWMQNSYMNYGGNYFNTFLPFAQINPSGNGYRPIHIPRGKGKVTFTNGLNIIFGISIYLISSKDY